MKILLAAPVQQKPAILKEWFNSIERLDKTGIDLDYAFIEDNIDLDSRSMLFKWKNQHDNTYIMYSDKHEPLKVDDTHHWDFPLITIVGHNKNIIIQYALGRDYDGIYFVDSDILTHPQTLKQLISTRKDIVSEIFWTRWQSNQPLLPQVWLYDLYDMVPRKAGEMLSNEEATKRINEWLHMLKQPGLYEVGGLGALTFLSRKALEMGVNFSPIKNLTIWGGDRWFCIRAVVKGLELWVDTHYPAYHIYRESDLSGVSEFWKGVENGKA